MIFRLRKSSTNTALFTGLLVSLFFLMAGMNIQDNPYAPKGIILGNSWNSITRELDEVFTEQRVIDLGERGVKKVQVWTEIVNCEGREFTWVIEYKNGLRQEILTQKIRYNRFRTYIEKTFRRNLWDSSTKELINVCGECRIILLDKSENNNIIIEKELIIK
ncbi:MAG: hypothetical protein GY863_23340 [bacterium]|nr:hypothetical protein [bacterium]